MKIDIVYLWVDSTDKKWRATKNKWEKIIKGAENVPEYAYDESRWRDNGEFKHSLRSVAKYAPWVNHIYIITGFNQVPKWLNAKHPKITIIPHEDIFPADALPTFNSNAIEMCIPNIKGLSEHFLLMNDDFFFNRPLSPDFFYDKKGRAKVLYASMKQKGKNVGRWLEKEDAYTQTLILSAKKISDIYKKNVYKYRPSHGIDPYIKSSWEACRNHPLFNKQIDEQIRNKFRTNNEIQRWMFNLYDFVHGKAKFYHARAMKHSKFPILSFLYNTMFYFQTKKSPVYCTDTKTAAKALKRAPIFCINDSIDTDEQILKNNANYMEKRFPEKSPFEK